MSRQGDFPPLGGLTVLFASFILIALLAISVLVLGHEIGKLRGDQEAPSTISSPAPAGQVGSDGSPGGRGYLPEEMRI